ncbi:hypothetical protein ELE36_06055 [Pseudolysobacter antarcticus]|uniref:Sulfotransferase family protein n=1 Tax=Pseudolysobacter antarcticus TaxID=2511995 RepID=A0A411HHT4_9GAMM|nr:hypothetical protein [Pseudolysobacter antarcticus]QBB69960.1 hypothetical protein ELE36_06055 [Pseudolysobacter antarcticus]
MPSEAVEFHAPDMIGWIPFRIRDDGACLLIDWCNVADGQLEDAYFDQTIHRLLHDDARTLRTTSINVLSGSTNSTPAGFIFHISRCGSTLITRMLASVQRFTVFSEPAILETVLRGSYRQNAASNKQTVALLKNIIDAFVNHRADGRATFIKFTARAISDYALVMKAYPQVPCLFVYRDPIEVLVSLIGTQGERLPPGLSEAGLMSGDPQEIGAMTAAEFWARVVAGQCAAALEMCSCSQPLLVNYSELPAAIWTHVANALGIEFSGADIQCMQGAITHNAKDPRKRFADDRAAKHAAATPPIRALTERWVTPHYDRLESIRVAARYRS